MADGVLALLGYVVPFLFVFSLVVFVHEMGHFWVARAFGVRIEAFSLGFGRTLVSWTDRRGTDWRIGLIPLGGFVRFFGDANAASAPDRARLAELRAELDAREGAGAAASCFHFKPVWQRAAVVAAGPAANFLLSIVIFAGVALAFGEERIRPRVAEVVVGSAADEAGVRAGDLVIAAGGRKIAWFDELQNEVFLSRDERFPLVVERDGARVALEATLGARAIIDQFGREVQVGGLGVRMDGADAEVIRYGLLGALWRGCERTWDVSATTLRYFARLVTGRENLDQVGGVLRIGGVAGKTASAAYEAGGAEASPVQKLAASLLALGLVAALVSVSLGIINLLPIPILDGGHLVYYAYEAVAGRPLGAQAQEWGFRIGLALVLGLMVFATVNDLLYLRVFDAIGSWFG